MAVQSGGQLAPALTGISEADLVALTLCSTSMDLRQRTAELTQTTGALRHSEERLKTLSDDLRHALDERRRLVNRLVSAQENERQRVARELHDHLGQYAAAMLFRLKTADQASNWHDEWHENLGELKTMALAMSQEIHRLSWELRPAALDELGLEVAIANYVETWSGRFNLVVDFVANLRGRRLSAPVEIVLYRVLQEAVTNVAKHAQAEKISVVLEAKPSEVSMIVEDNGIGIGDTNVSFPAGPASGFGLVGIRERLALVGGSLVIESAPNCGTTLCCRIPA